MTNSHKVTNVLLGKDSKILKSGIQNGFKIRPI